MRILLIIIGVLLVVGAACIFLYYFFQPETMEKTNMIIKPLYTAPPPPLPQLQQVRPQILPTVQESATRNPLDFPRCPIDRRRNEPGKPQLIFWDAAHSCYICGNGHQFTGRE